MLCGLSKASESELVLATVALNAYFARHTYKNVFFCTERVAKEEDYSSKGRRLNLITDIYIHASN